MIFNDTEEQKQMMEDFWINHTINTNVVIIRQPKDKKKKKSRKKSNLISSSSTTM